MAVAEAAAGSPAGRPVSTAEQLGFEGMPRRLFAATPSRLGTFTACPRRYRLTYLVRPTPPKGAPWAHNSLGAAVHNALRDWWLLPARRRTPGAAGALLDAGWISDGFADAGQSARWRARAREWVEAYVATLDPADEPIGVERGVAARTERLALSGRVDRIDLPRRRAGRRRLQDRPVGARHRRRPRLARAGGLRAGRPADAAPAVPAGWSCTTCRPAGSPAGSTPTSRWPGTLPAPANTADDIEAAAGAVAAGATADEAYPPAPGRQCGVVRLPPALPGGPGGGAGAGALGRPGGPAPAERRRPGLDPA